MKKLYLIGNMKMNMSYSELEPYFERLAQIASTSTNVVGVCVPSVYLNLAKYILEGSKVLYGAENMFYEDSGAYTGEISADMLMDFNTDMVIVGHSERRQYFKETNNDVNLKVKKALEKGITPILCFGETLEERNSNIAHSIVEKELIEGLKDLESDDVQKIIFAYEPIWAIGTGVSATAQQAEEMIAFAKRTINEQYGLENSIVLYGGSLKPSNADEILSQKSIDGGLIGGACLKLDDFEQIINKKVE